MQTEQIRRKTAASGVTLADTAPNKGAKFSPKTALVQLAPANEALVCSIAMTAVNVARKYQVRKVDELKALLDAEYPGHTREVEAALQLFARRVRDTEAS